MNYVAVRPENLNLISLCTGGGGLDLGVQLAMPGARSVVLVEREAFGCAHLVAAMQEGLLDDAPLWSDVTTFNGRPWRGIVDGLIGGIPCQPHSLAGKRLGEDDERDLWSDARRIIVQSGAWFVLIENVRGIVSSGGAERVWRDLSRLGFVMEAGLFTASEVGASHERERWFGLAVADRRCHGFDRCEKPHREPVKSEQQARGRRDLERCNSDVGRSLANACSSRLQGRERSGSSAERHGATAYGSATKLCGASLVDAIGGRRTARRNNNGSDERNESDSTSELALVNAIGSGHHGRANGAVGRPIGRTVAEGPGEPSFGNVEHAARQREQRDLRDQTTAECPAFGNVRIIKPNEGCWRTDCDDAGGSLSLFPPGPSDLHSWRHTLERAPQLEPAFRRVADGLASRLDIARVDRLRMLGNGVVSLEAAYALRTLATRLAATGSRAAKRLVRAMELAT